jgi:predicted component of viral defense system (DUF524 family)
LIHRARSTEKDSRLLDYFEDIYRSHKLAPAVLAAALSACATETVLLNSERVENQFGSYGIDVLASEAGLRRSSLYSIEGSERICRTYAIVSFKEDLDSSYGHEHSKVLAGNSLGEVFKANGWSMHKQTLHIGSFEIERSVSEISQLMQLAEDQTLALHVYQLLLAKDEQIFEYATIVEAHHPDYLSQSNLLDIYHYDDSESLSAESLAELIDLLTSKRGQ